MQGSRRVRWWVAVLATAVSVTSTAGTATAAVSRSAVPRAAADLAVGSVVSQRSFAELAQISGAKTVGGDVNGDGLSDLVLTGGTGWAGIPVGLSNGDGTFTVINESVDNFPGWAQNPDAKVTAGDFNDDDRTDLALTGGAGWNTIPLALSNGDGTFTISNPSAPAFAGWAQIRGAKVTAGNFTNDTRTDLVITGVGGFSTIPLATANTNGTFTITNQSAPDFAGWAQIPGVTVTAGTFNNDTRTDLALTGGTGWNTIPMATPNTSGAFTITNQSAPDFAGWGSTPGVKVVAGTFNDDTRTDLALVGGAGFSAVPLATPNTSGTFTISNQTAPNFPGWAQHPGARVIAGNFNDDTRTDLALVGGAGWDTIPIAYPTTTNTFTVTNQKVTGIPHWAQNPNATIIAGNFNTDTHTDLLITGNRGTSSLPTALSNGPNGTFTTPLPPTPTPLEAGTLTLPGPNDARSGEHNSITVGTDGLPIIASHVHGDRKDLRVTHCNDPACTTVTTTDIDTPGWVGQTPSIKTGADGLPLIAYVAASNAQGAFIDDLRVAHCNNIACTSATIAVLDPGAHVIGPPSVAMGRDGFGLISYIDAKSATESTVKVAHCLNAACTAFRLSNVETISGTNGIDSASLATGPAGLGIMSYRSSNAVRVAACNDADCTTSVRSTIENAAAGMMMEYGSGIAVGIDGLALIIYTTSDANPQGYTKVAHCENVHCTTATTATILTGNANGVTKQLAIGGDGLGVIVWFRGTTQDLRVAHCVDIACSAATDMLVDEFERVGSRPSIVAGADGLPVIVDQGEGPNGPTLRVTQCSDVGCTGLTGAPF